MASAPASILRSSIGKKVLVALTGLMLLGFVIMHLLGNLTVFLGPDGLNAYALKLRHLGALLWVARGILLVAVVAHIVFSIRLSIDNRLARPQRYAKLAPRESTEAGRGMWISGLMILAFVIYHLAHFTFGLTHPHLAQLIDATGRHDIYTMVVTSFQDPIISAFYLVAMGLLCAHLSHGIASTCQTLGINDEAMIPVVKRAGATLAGLIFLGYASIPVSAWLGVLR